MKKTLLALGSVAVAFYPYVVLAQTGGTDVNSLITKVSGWITTLIPVLLALALLAFFWGMVKYIWAAGNAEGQADGKKIMIAGIVGLFVMVAIWGLVGIIASTLNVTTGGQGVPPTVKTN